MDVPFYMSYDDGTFGAGLVQRDTSLTPMEAVNTIGVENLMLVSEYAVGQETSDENHADTAVLIDRASNCWLSDLVAKHFINGFVAGYDTRYVTIQDSQVLDPVSQITGGRRYSFSILGSFVLVQRCYADKGRHDYVTTARVQGPNVFLNSTSGISYSDTGPHERWAFGTLYDRIQSAQINCINRGFLGTGQGKCGMGARWRTRDP